MGDSNDDLFMSPQQVDLDGFNPDFTPDLDYLDGDNFDFDNADLGGEMIGALPGSGADAPTNGDGHEKRKNSGDSEEGDAKRQEVQEGEKSAKKPGRKPLTSEPTTKRKAQNRAAQRAFRERKEKHLKDLETKVEELTKSDEANKHENGVLKAQVERLQVELRDYRKRLSLNRGSVRNPSPTGVHGSSGRGSSISSASPGNFAFEFPKFGSLPGSQIFGPGSVVKSPSTDASRHNSLTPSNSASPATTTTSQTTDQRQRTGSAARSLSPQVISNHSSTLLLDANASSAVSNLNPAFTMHSSANNMHGFANTLPQMRADGSDPFGDLFSPSILKSAGLENSGQYFTNLPDTTGTSNHAAPSVSRAYSGDSGRQFQFNSANSSTDSTSPSAASSNWNANTTSSCGTSPAPSHDSPANKDKILESFTAASNPTTTINNVTQPTTSTNDLSNSFFGFGEYSVPSTASFDPVLFGDYRDSNEAIVGGGDFTGGFFDDALNPSPYDLGSPSNLFGILQSPAQTHQVPDLGNSNSAASVSAAATAPTPSQLFMASVDKASRGGDDDYGLPNTATTSTATTATASTVSPTAVEGSNSDKSGKLISCNNIWNQLQSNTDYQDGKFDLEGLCSELRTKARCSESGVLVNQDYVDAALRKLGTKKPGEGATSPPTRGSKLMFEQASWDNVLKKMGQGKK